MHGNMVPVLMQWKGLGPEAPAEDTRNLRISSGPTAAQLFYQRRMQSPPTSNEIESVLEARRLDENDFNHVVTFQDCVFRVSSEFFLDLCSCYEIERLTVYPYLNYRITSWSITWPSLVSSRIASPVSLILSIACLRTMTMETQTIQR
jgi:hypothetical protein